MKNMNSTLIRPEMIMITLGVMAVSMCALVVAADTESKKNSIGGSGSQDHLVESSTVVESRLIIGSDDGE